MKEKKWKKMNEGSFKQVKSLLDAGIKVALVSKAIGIGRGTVARVLKSKDFSDYKENALKYYREYRKPTMPKKVTVAPVEVGKEGSRLSTAVTDRLDRMIELLTEIKNKKIKLF